MEAGTSANSGDMPSSLSTNIVPQIRIAHANGDHERAARLRRHLIDIETYADGIRKSTEALDRAVTDAHALGLSLRDVAEATGGLYSYETVRRICRAYADPQELAAALERSAVRGSDGLREPIHTGVG